jgi:hypothetical protein
MSSSNETKESSNQNNQPKTLTKIGTKLQNIRFVNSRIDISYVFLDKTTAIEASLIKAENSHKTTCFVDKYRNADFFIGKVPGNLPPALDATKLYEYYLMNEWLKYIAVDEITPQRINTGFIQLLKKDDGPYLPLFNRKYQTTGFIDPNALYDMDFTSFYDVEDNNKITWTNLLTHNSTLIDNEKKKLKNDVGFDIKIKGGKRDGGATKQSFDWADSISGFYKLSVLIMEDKQFYQKIGLWDEKCSVCDTETISEYSTIHTHYSIPVNKEYMCDMEEYERGGIWSNIRDKNYQNPLVLLYNLIACKFIRRICAIIYNKKLTQKEKTDIIEEQDKIWETNLNIDNFHLFLKNLGHQKDYGFNPTGAEKKETSLGRCKSLYNKFKGTNDEEEKVEEVEEEEKVEIELDLGDYGDAPKELITEVIGVLKSTKNGKTFKKTYEAFNEEINALIKGTHNSKSHYLIKVTPKGLARTPQMSFPFALKNDRKANKHTNFTLTFPKSASALSKSRGGNTLNKLSSTFNSALFKWVKEDQSRKDAFEKWAEECKKKSKKMKDKAFNYNITNKQQLSNISCIRWLKSMYKDDEEEDENILIKIARKEYEKLFEDKPNTNDKYTLTDILDELTKKEKPHLSGGVYMRGGGDKDDYIINMIGLLAWSIVNVELKPKQGGQFTENEYRNTSILQLAIENTILNKNESEITVSYKDKENNNNDIYTLIDMYNNMVSSERDRINQKVKEHATMMMNNIKKLGKPEKYNKASENKRLKQPKTTPLKRVAFGSTYRTPYSINQKIPDSGDTVPYWSPRRYNLSSPVPYPDGINPPTPKTGALILGNKKGIMTTGGRKKRTRKKRKKKKRTKRKRRK